MTEYEVIIHENLIRRIKIEAKDETEAMKKVRELYNKEKIILDADDLEDTYIYVEKD